MMNTSPQYSLNSNSDAEKEIGLGDIIRFFKDGKFWIISMTGMSALLGAAYAFTIQPEYEASASIEMASIAGSVVEAPSMLVEKLKLPLYYSEDTYKVCLSENKQATPGEFLTSHLKLIVNKNAPIVSMKFKASSAIQAKQCLESVYSDVKKNQDVLSKPILESRQSQLELLQQKLEGAEKIAALLPIKHMKIDHNDPKFPAFALLLAMSITKESEIKDLSSQINGLQISLAEPQTRGTTLITPIYAPNVEVESKTALLILSSTVAGLLLGILFSATKRIFYASTPHKTECMVV